MRRSGVPLETEGVAKRTSSNAPSPVRLDTNPWLSFLILNGFNDDHRATSRIA